MFRDSDLDSFYDVQPNATCTDCGVDFSRGEHDPTSRCDACSDRRDTHTSRLERRLVMAKASTRAVEPMLTPSEISLVVALLGLGYTKARALARIQERRSSLPFGSEVA